MPDFDSTTAELPAEKSFEEQVDATIKGTLNRYDDIKVCDTPNLLLKVGCEQLPMLYTQQHLRKAIKPYNLKKHQHGLTVEQIKDIPNHLDSPVMILDSQQRGDSIVVVSSMLDVNSNPIIATVAPCGNGHYSIDISSNFITSIYGRENFSNFVENSIANDAVLYYDKEKSQELFSLLGLQFSEGLNNLDPNVIIHQSENIVKYPDEKNNNNFVLTNDMSLDNVLDLNHELEAKMTEINPLAMTTKEKQIISDYQEVKGFITELSHGLEFSARATGITYDNEEKLYKASMLPATECAENIQVLTNGGNSDFVKAVFEERTLPSETVELSKENGKEVAKELMYVRTFSEIKSELDSIPMNDSGITVGQAKEVLSKIDERMSELGIDKEKAYTATAEKFTELNEEGELINLSEEAVKKEREGRATIVESNDGYIMNTSEEITAETLKEIVEDNNIENVNEVKQAIAKETTNELADVRPNVQYEKVDDTGSKEKAEINSGNGIDSDIEKLAQQSQNYESQTDRANEKPAKKHRKADIDRD